MPLNSVVADGVAVWTVTALICYAFLKRASYNILDPLIVQTIFLPFSAALLFVLCATDLVTWSKFLLFAVCMTSYLLGARVVTSRFRRSVFRERIIAVVADFTRAELNSLLLFALILTLMLGLLALATGAEGNARQQFQKVFRPIFLFQHGLFLVCLALLLSRKLSTSRAACWVAALAAFSIPFSGKSVFLPMLYWLGLRYFVSGRRVTLRAAMTSAGLVISGVAIMALTAYGKSGAAGVVALLGIRLWMSGDVYILAYQRGALDALRNYYHVSFIPYVFHPITALVGIRAYEYPLGAMLASEVSGATKLTGPNPQLPVLLDFFFPDALATICLIAFVIGFLVIGIRAASIPLSRSRARFMRLGGITAALFAPDAGFVDMEQVWMQLVAIAAIVVTGALLDLFFKRRAAPHRRSAPAAEAPQRA
jgi:hypothetical protein